MVAAGAAGPLLRPLHVAEDVHGASGLILRLDRLMTEAHRYNPRPARMVAELAAFPARREANAPGVRPGSARLSVREGRVIILGPTAR